MKKDGNACYILQVSDFHISENSAEEARKALKAVSDKLAEMDIHIKYLIHTGDVINAKDVATMINPNDENYDNCLEGIISKRFDTATRIVNEFVGNLDVLRKNTIICCGNHDKVRYQSKEKDAFKFNVI